MANMVEPQTALPTFILDNHQHQVVWLLKHQDWSKQILGTELSFALPVFLAAGFWERYKVSGTLEISPSNEVLIGYGILYTWMETAKWMYPVESLDTLRLKLLQGIAKRHGDEPVEALAHIAATWARSNCGCLPSWHILAGALSAGASSSRLRYDFLLDTWLLLELDGADAAIKPIGTSIIEQWHELDLEALRRESGEAGQRNVNTACYIYLAALILLRDAKFVDGWHRLVRAGVMKAPGMERKLAAAAHHPSIDAVRCFTRPSGSGEGSA